MDKKGVLVTNKYVYEGHVVGDVSTPIGFELCFNTSMTGYQEIITDPSYLNQVITFTSVHIGNVGCNSADMESMATVKGIITREKPSKSSSWRAERDFEEWCVKNHMFCLYGVDTRSIVEKIRNKEASTGVVGYAGDLDGILKIKQKQFDTEGMDLASLACSENIRKIEQQNGKRIAALDFGIKNNILNCLHRQGFDLVVYPCTEICNYVEEIQSADGLFLSNGPGDPRATLRNVPELETIVKYFVKEDKAIFGICLGHQILSLIFGARVEKMSQGHRGGNQPVINYSTKNVEITAQNHGFAVLEEDLAKNKLNKKYESLFDGVVEGFEFIGKKIISVQYHPESSPGPRDSRYIFEDFRKLFY
ncbi:MAG: glutamine-hydrolyzing carbamoyl-phosphate synthase small subunit [Rickettsiales bacterium]|jgi:carbamoyl-phosphate synthase small subunit|nr:glutamine-hydrolyzing carbamoyl-phosphate synthase small subunit [Rickettsiales bacterium]